MPLELLTMLGSGLLGGLMTIWKQAITAKQIKAQMELEALAGKRLAWKEAREMNGKVAQITRRFITIATVLAVIVLPKVAAIFWPDVLVVVGYTEWNPGFWPFVDGHNEINWRSYAGGVVITPLDTHLVAAIVGFYFGHRIGK